jgi:hypothetical protein
VPLVVGGIATILYLHCVAAVVWPGGYEQDFGWGLAGSAFRVAMARSTRDRTVA